MTALARHERAHSVSIGDPTLSLLHYVSERQARLARPTVMEGESVKGSMRHFDECRKTGEIGFYVEFYVAEARFPDPRPGLSQPNVSERSATAASPGGRGGAAKWLLGNSSCIRIVWFSPL